MNSFRKVTILLVTGALMFGLSGCDLSKGDVEAPGVSSTASTE
jgi:hypothetical protein